MTDSGKLNIVTLCGSLREGSFNAALLRALPELAPDRMSFTPAVSIAGIPLYNADDQNADGFPDAVKALGDQIRAADGVIIATPEYNYSVTGVLKNAIDWVSRLPDQPFKDKPVAIQSTSGGLLGGARAQYHLRQIMVFLEAMMFNKPEIMVTFAKGKFDENTLALTDEPTRDIVGKQLDAFAGFIGKVGG
ncbi:NADPH-dependent FMN reductase [Breoghania sp. L-A4]|uniref:NADPH-dependent FMN reductase n=1 Tax=Breoghania sp. L-A4 TaxID=2304600 RepID=UPI000E35ADBC|nr:NADPH-dependent FMN reductase [Breoghania sp. L-A4]AXS38885.1 NAD(P)H-dependent oxidoreductase [Breoghania sp. L-A4]